MKHRSLLPILALTVLLAGCASTLRTEVTAFNAWPAEMADKSFVFTPPAQADLEYRHYQDLVSAQLQALGFTAASNDTAALQVAVDYYVNSHEVRVSEPIVIDPGWYGAPPWFGLQGRGWGYYGPYGPWRDPFWYQPMVVQPREVSYPWFERRLKIQITQRRDQARLYEVTVSSSGRTAALAAVMPAMIRAAFIDFPGPNGVPRNIDLKLP